MLRNFCIAMLAIFLSACAHESKVLPSDGHIDGKNPQSSPNTNNSTFSIPKPVKNSIYLPPPKAKAKEQTYSVVVNEVPVKEILFALARESKLNIDIHPSIQGKATLNAVDQPLMAILERLAKQVDLTYKIENNVLSIQPDKPVLRTYQINYVNMDRITTGGISVSTQIASASQSTTSASSGSGASSGSTSGQNTSSTVVKTSSENHFWDSLIKNIQDILLESDKEVLISKISTDSTLRDTYNSKNYLDVTGTGSAATGLNQNARNTNNTTGNGGVTPTSAGGSGNETVDSNSAANRDAARQSTSKEYRELYAASVIPNKETGVITVRATERQQEKVQEYLDKIQANAKRQVLIEASIVEVTLNDQYQAGVDWSRLGQGGLLDGFTFQQNLLGTTLSSSPRIAIGYNKSTSLGDIAASIRMLQTYGTTKVLSSPKLMVLNSQTAILKAVDNLVYFTVKADTNTSTVGSTQTTFTTTPQTVPVGVWMSVTPQINQNGSVTLDVRPTISRQSGSVRDPNPSLTISSLIPQIQTREMESVLQVESGNTVVLGGLMQDTINNTTNGVPELGSLPIIGNAFKARDKRNTKSELIIFIRPTVINNASLESDELKSYKQYLPELQLQQEINESSN